MDAVLLLICNSIGLGTFKDEVDRPQAGGDARRAFTFRYDTAKLVGVRFSGLLGIIN